MIVTVLGSCANQTATRESVSFLTDSLDRSTSILVDAGPGIVAALGRSERSAADINNVLLTHAHGDHVLGFAYFIWQRYYEHLGTPHVARDIDVYGLDNVIELARRMLYGCYAETKFPFQINFHSINPNSEFKIGPFGIATCSTRHTTPSLGLTISEERKKIGISSDTLFVDDFITLSTGVDILFQEGMWTEAYREIADRSMHSTASEAAEIARAAKAKQLVLMHVSPDFLGKEGELLIEAARVFTGPISVPHDGSVYLA